MFAPRIVDAQSADYVLDVPRILRADGTIAYRGAVHEYPVVTGPTDSPVRLRGLDVEVRHDGYHPAVRQANRKVERNFALLAHARAQDPADPRWRYFPLHNPLSITDSATVTGLCDELATLAERGVRTGITDDDLLTTIQLRQDESLVARSTICVAGRHLDALIAALLDLRQSPDDADEYRSMCAPWSDVFFAESRPRLAPTS